MNTSFIYAYLVSMVNDTKRGEERKICIDSYSCLPHHPLYQTFIKQLQLYMSWDQILMGGVTK